MFQALCRDIKPQGFIPGISLFEKSRRSGILARMSLSLRLGGPL